MPALLRPDAFYGRLDEVTFLGRVWDLGAMPSTDYRESSLEADLRRHIAWGDYNDSEVLYGKVNIGRCPDEQFGRFLAECIHPLVRNDERVAAELLALFNEHLAEDGFVLVETSRISNRPIYEMAEIGSPVAVQAQRYDVALSFAGEDRETTSTRSRSGYARRVSTSSTIASRKRIYGVGISPRHSMRFFFTARASP